MDAVKLVINALLGSLRFVIRSLTRVQTTFRLNQPKQSLEPALKLLESVVANNLKQVEALKKKTNTFDADVGKCFGKDWVALTGFVNSFWNSLGGCSTRVSKLRRTKSTPLTTRGNKLVADTRNVVKGFQNCFASKAEADCPVGAVLNAWSKAPLLVAQAFNYVLSSTSTYVSLQSTGATCVLSRTNEAFTKATKQTVNIAGCLTQAVDKNLG